jgi:hypothetical protein
MARGNITFNTPMRLYLELLLRRLQYISMLLVLDELDFVLLEGADSCRSHRGTSTDGCLPSYNHPVIVVSSTNT